MTTRTIPTETSMRILRKRHVLEMLRVASSSLDRWVASGLFPRPIKLGERAIGWREADVRLWLERKAAAARS